MKLLKISSMQCTGYRFTLAVWLRNSKHAYKIRTDYAKNNSELVICYILSQNGRKIDVILEAHFVDTFFGGLCPKRSLIN